jgi:selenide,water dikinase
MSDVNKKNLCGFSRNLGCASKLRKSLLKGIINALPRSLDQFKDKITCNYDSFDDAAVYRLDDKISVVFTIDFITPVTNDPKRYGQIAVANALSDIYAKGASPCIGLNVLGFPGTEIDLSTVEEVLSAAHYKAEEANMIIVGGHTINLSEFFYGLAVLGFAANNEIILNSGACRGDALILTKPLGTNVILTMANRAGLKIGPEIIEEVYNTMCQINKIACTLMKEVGVNACTDISGYGFIGHLSQMLEASNKKAIIWSSQIPVIKKSLELITMPYPACSAEVNKADYACNVEITKSIPTALADLMYDAHTSGGLLISLPKLKSDILLEKLHNNKILCASVVGEIVDPEEQNSLIVVQ